MMADIGTPGPPSAIESQHSRSDSRSVTSSGSRSSRSRGNVRASYLCYYFEIRLSLLVKMLAL
jgi:hypothetical protein